ncbi:GNAT family N-acetyltransferase [Bacillus sp. 2205SS5-2]|uniref:GNAT family N-acetyltransferase n=1 Tax=Bacillus sp. 2205SS5-2 TaxID=3109031 RepID=UPI00300601B0
MRELQTNRLVLREITEEDAEALFLYFSQDVAMKFYGQNPFQHLDQAVRLTRAMKNAEIEKKAFRWGMESKETGKLIGTIGFNQYQPWNNKAEIGYDLNPEYWRKGYTEEALRAILSYGFEELDLHRIGATVFLENEPSYKLLEKLGFSREGVLRDYLYSYESFHDVFMYSLLKWEWS